MIEDKRFGQIAVGSSHTCALLIEDQASDSKTYEVECWGAVVGGATGISSDDCDAECRSTPRRVDVLAYAVYAGSDRSCAVLGDARELWCWGGSGSNVRLGRGWDSDWNTLAPSPVVAEGRAPLTGVEHVSLGNLVACASFESSGVACWGMNNAGQLGSDGAPDDCGTGPCSAHALAVPALKDARVDGLASTSSTTCALAAGRVSCWGSNDYGALGRGAGEGELEHDARPGDVGLAHVRAIRAGNRRFCALRDEPAGRSSLWCWGLRIAELGPPSGDHAPVRVELIDDPREVALGDEHACFLDASGAAYCAGRGSHGQLGNGTTDDALEPSLVLGLD